MLKQFLDAHNKKLSNKTMVARQDVKDTEFAGSGDQRDIMRCFVQGYRAEEDCPSRVSTSRESANYLFLSELML